MVATVVLVGEKYRTNGAETHSRLSIFMSALHYLVQVTLAIHIEQRESQFKGRFHYRFNMDILDNILLWLKRLLNEHQPRRITPTGLDESLRSAQRQGDYIKLELECRIESRSEIVT